MFWTALLTGVVVFLAINVGCLVYLARPRELDPPDAAVVSMLRRIATYHCIPLLWMGSYFSLRLWTAGAPEEQPLFYVGYASVGYGMALIGLALSGVCAVVLVYHRERSLDRSSERPG